MGSKQSLDINYGQLALAFSMNAVVDPEVSIETPFLPKKLTYISSCTPARVIPHELEVWMSPTPHVVRTHVTGSSNEMAQKNSLRKGCCGSPAVAMTRWLVAMTSHACLRLILVYQCHTYNTRGSCLLFYRRTCTEGSHRCRNRGRGASPTNKDP